MIRIRAGPPWSLDASGGGEDGRLNGALMTSERLWWGGCESHEGEGELQKI